MLSAQLHHKVPIEFERMEDVLTSSVFALLRYLPAPVASHLLSKWADIPGQPGQAEVVFWPRHPTPAGFQIFLDSADPEDSLGRGDTEPDVVIRTQDWLVLVEVKYQSHLDQAYDQLSREFAIGYQLARNDGLRFRLLAMTANALEPRPAGLALGIGVQQALARARDAGGHVTQEMIASVPDSLRWIGWHRVYRTLSQAAIRPHVAQHSRRLLEDTCRLLEMRGLKPYSSRPLADAMRRWDSAGIPATAWAAPTSFRPRTATSLASGWTVLSQLDAGGLHPIAWQLE